MNFKIRVETDRTKRDSAAIFRRYAAKLEAIAALDRAYFATNSPNLAERAAYYQRQAVLERTRLRLYAELDRVRERAGAYPFVFFAVMMVVQFFVVLFVYPETKGFTLEEMQKRVVASG